MITKNDIKHCIASGLYTGLIPFIPGSAAALIGVILYSGIIYFFNETNHIIVLLALTIAILMTVTYNLYSFALDEWKNSDAKEFVLDEIIGMLSTFLFIHLMRGLFNINPDLKCYKYADMMKVFTEVHEQFQVNKFAGQGTALGYLGKISDQKEARIIIGKVCAIADSDGDFDDNEKAAVVKMCGVMPIQANEFGL